MKKRLTGFSMDFLDAWLKWNEKTFELHILISLLNEFFHRLSLRVGKIKECFCLFHYILTFKMATRE